MAIPPNHFFTIHMSAEHLPKFTMITLIQSPHFLCWKEKVSILNRWSPHPMIQYEPFNRLYNLFLILFPFIFFYLFLVFKLKPVRKTPLLILSSHVFLFSKHPKIRLCFTVTVCPSPLTVTSFPSVLDKLRLVFYTLHFLLFFIRSKILLLLIFLE